MKHQSRTTDQKGRVILPKGFANATVIVEQLSPTELRIRKAVVVPQDEMRFAEEAPTRLSNRDRDMFLAALEKPSKPKAARTRPAKRRKKSHG